MKLFSDKRTHAKYTYSCLLSKELKGCIKTLKKLHEMFKLMLKSYKQMRFFEVYADKKSDTLTCLFQSHFTPITVWIPI